MKHLCHLFMFSVALVLGTTSTHGANVLSTTLRGSNEVPPNASTATGSALVTLESDNNTLDVNETFAGLTGATRDAYRRVEEQTSAPEAPNFFKAFTNVGRSNWMLIPTGAALALALVLRRTHQGLRNAAAHGL